MAWTMPMTWVDGQAITAAQLNANVRDNLMETAPAKATGDSWPAHFVANAANSIAERLIRDNNIDTSESTASTSYVDLTTVGPSVTMTTGAYALCFLGCQVENSVAGGPSRASVEFNGAGATDGRGVTAQNAAGYVVRAGSTQLLNPGSGSNTFKMLYRVTSGTGTFAVRRLCVMGL